MPREKSRYRDRRSSSYNSDSSYEKKRLKSKYRRRSRSRDGSEFTARRRKRSSSRSKHKRRSYSRSVSRDRYDMKSRKRSSSRSRTSRIRRSISRGRSHSRSSSKSRSKYSKGNRKNKRRSRSTSSRSDSFDIEPANPIKRVNHDDTNTKIEKAIKAAEAAGLTLTKIPTYEVKEVKIKEDMPTIHDRNLLAELNSESFVQKSFTSSKNKKQSQNIVIDLNSDTVKVPDSKIKVEKEDSIIDFDELPNEEELKEMWIKKVYQYRKKLLRGEI